VNTQPGWLRYTLKWGMFRTAVFGLLLAFVFGCAKFPEGGGGVFTKRFRFVIRLAAPVNPNYVYIFAINDADDITGEHGGPLPVIAPPWGNGFVAGKATHFIRYDGFQPNGGYAVFKFVDQTLLTYFQTGIPISFTTPGPDDNFLEFEIDATQLRPNPNDALQIRALQINLLTMDRVITDPNDHGPKHWDALGDSRDPGSSEDYITIDTTGPRIYRNSDMQNEPEGDVDDPSLDIVDWTIEVRTQ
jgi:hypothetical protein